MVDSYTYGLIFSDPQRSVSCNRSNFTRADLPRVGRMILPTASSYGYCDTPIPKYVIIIRYMVMYHVKF